MKKTFLAVGAFVLCVIVLVSCIAGLRTLWDVLSKANLPWILAGILAVLLSAFCTHVLYVYMVQDDKEALAIVASRWLDAIYFGVTEKALILREIIVAVVFVLAVSFVLGTVRVTNNLITTYRQADAFEEVMQAAQLEADSKYKESIARFSEDLKVLQARAQELEGENRDLKERVKILEEENLALQKTTKARLSAGGQGNL